MSAPAGSIGQRPGVSAPKDDDIPLLNNQAYEVKARASCDPIFDKWVLCLLGSECFKSKGAGAGNAELKQCARKNAAGVPEDCATLHEAVKLCNRSQVSASSVSLILHLSLCSC